MNIKYISYFVVGLLVLTVFGIGIVVWASNEKDDAKRIQIENKTSLIVESIRNLEDSDDLSRFEVTIRNGYEKPIVVYRLRINDETTQKNTIYAVEKGGFIGSSPILSNETSTVRFSAATKGTIKLTLAAAVFEDGTGDGVSSDLLRLREIQIGVAMALQKIAPIFRQVKEKGEVPTSEAAIESLEDKISSISDEDIPLNSRSGFAQAKSYFNFELKDLKTRLGSKPNLNIKEEITKQLNNLERSLTKLRTNSVMPQ